MTLRIHRSASANRVTLTLSGELTGEDVAELRTLIERQRTANVVLDLSELTFVTRDGVDFIRSAVASGAEIVNCPSYIRRWISNGQETA